MRYFIDVESVSKVTEDLNFLSVESEFGHLRLMQDVKDLSHEDLLTVLSAVHKQCLIKQNLFVGLLKYCTAQGMELPPLEELLQHK